jgi:hypothetical protein
LIELNPCKECGIPEYIAKEHSWLNNGDIVQSRESWHRMVFIDSENIDALLGEVEEIMGISIEHLVITAQRRAVRMYLSKFIPEEVKELVRSKRIEQRPLAEAIGDMARMMGFGNYQYVDHRYEMDDDDYYTVSMKEPFSVPLAVASLPASMEVLTGRDQGVRYTRVEPDTYYVTAFPASHLEELKERMWLKNYYHQAGGFELEKCPSCGAPKNLAQYVWDLKRGVIQSRVNERRMVIIGWQNLDPILVELEDELGTDIPDILVEAQRRFVRGGFYELRAARSEETLREELAIRGLGYVKEFKTGRKGLLVVLQNVVLPVIIVGLMQGAYEASLNVDSHVEWECSEEGQLKIELEPLY